jgi:hypothetical protein
MARVAGPGLAVAAKAAARMRGRFNVSLMGPVNYLAMARGGRPCSRAPYRRLGPGSRSHWHGWIRCGLRTVLRLARWIFL